jgi:hypothetical protein
MTQMHMMRYQAFIRGLFPNGAVLIGDEYAVAASELQKLGVSTMLFNSKDRPTLRKTVAWGRRKIEQDVCKNTPLSRGQ